MSSLAVAAALAGAILLVPVTILFVQVACSLLPGGAPHGRAEARQVRVAVLVPAHNEATVITETLSRIVPQLRTGDRLVVVADNCSDDTARLAGAAGAEVIVREDARRRGKGYALDFGVRYLESDPPDVVVVIDADCSIEPDVLRLLGNACAVESRPVQAAYLMHAAPNAKLGSRVAEFAWLVKNYVRPIGSRRLGLPCQLMGTGMAFPWPCLRTATLASGEIVEDLVLGLELASAGKSPEFCPDARVTSRFAGEGEGDGSQRTRWEHGHLTAILARGPGLLARAIGKADVCLVGMVLDACVPPLALLSLITVVVIALAAAARALGGGAGPLALALIVAGMFASAILAAWWRHGREVIPFSGLVYAPYYAVAKIPLYARFLLRRQVDWVRARRKGE